MGCDCGVSTQEVTLKKIKQIENVDEFTEPKLKCEESLDETVLNNDESSSSKQKQPSK